MKTLTIPAATGTQNGNFKDISIVNEQLHELLMGAGTPVPPKMITAASPDRALPRRITTVEIIMSRFSWPLRSPDRFTLVSTNLIF